ncbi:hypothetical protein TYRP_008554 [Tyrophagus putrescentiae]|nr:hypothetical protein TYRP_008554 [Tyrophagus putrescentiae]
MGNCHSRPREENTAEPKLSLLELLPAQLKATIEQQSTIANASLQRMAVLSYGGRRPLLTVIPNILLNRQLQSLADDLGCVLRAFSGVYLRFTYQNKLPPPGSFLGDSDPTDPFFVLTRADIETGPLNLDFPVQAVQDQRHDADKPTPPPRHRPHVIELKRRLVAFVREIVGDLQEKLTNEAVILAYEEEIFDAANRILRCVPLIAIALNRTIEEEKEAEVNCLRVRANLCH